MTSKKATTIYLDRDVYDRLKELVSPKPVSREIDNLMRRRVEELEGGEYSPEQVDYENLEQTHQKLCGKADGLEKPLVRKGVYGKVSQCARRCGFSSEKLDFTPEIVECTLNGYEGPSEHVHQFIYLMEVIREKREVERQLKEIRLRRR